MRQAALGLQHAHEKGLVHRDIKPSNLLLTYADGVVKILDMGLARLQESVNSRHGALTTTGVIMGTPDYMAPEQARDSREADIRSDLYSLGCTLYFLLTGQVPFPGGTITEKLLRHNIEKPRPVAGLNADVPAPLAAVVHTLLEKDPGARYQTPAELVAALEPFAAAPRGAPRPRAGTSSAGPASRTQSLSPERPAPAVSSGTQPQGSLSPARGVPAPAAESRTFKGGVSSGNQDSAPWRTPVPRRRPVKLAALATVLVLAGAAAVGFFLFRKGPAADPPSARPAVAERAPEAAPSPPVAEPKPVVAPPAVVATPPPPAAPKIETRPEEVKPPTRSVEAPKVVEPARVEAPPAPAAPPKLLLGVLARFDKPTQAGTLRTALSANGEWAVASYDCKVQVWQVPAECRQDRATEALGTTFPATAVAVLPDGGRVLLGRPADDPSTPDGKVPPVLPFVSVWDPRLSRSEKLLRGHKDSVTAVALSPKGHFALSGGGDRTVRLWDLAHRAQKALLGSHDHKVTCVAYSADGGRGLSGDYGGRVVLWDLENGKKLATFEKHKNIVSCVAFSPDGRYALSGGFDGDIELYDAAKQECLRSFAGHGEAVRCVAFAPDSNHFVSGGDDKTLRLWSIHERENMKCFDEHNAAVYSAVVSADGKYAVFIGADQTIRRVELPPLVP